MNGSFTWRVLVIVGRSFRSLGLERAIPSVTALLMPLMPRTFRYRGSTIRANDYGEMQYLRQVARFGRDDFLDDMLFELIEPGMTVVDGGAQLGLTTLIAARAVGPTGCVFAFEPNPRTIPSLKKNISLNGLDGRVTVFPLGLSDERKTLQFEVSGYAGEGSRVVREGGLVGADDAVVEIDVVPLDELLPDVNPDVVKLDVEGHEVAALAGMQRLIGRNRPKLVLEVNTVALQTAGTSPAELFALLRRHRYAIYFVDERARTLRRCDSSSLEIAGVTKDYVDVIAVRAEDKLFAASWG